MTWAHWIVFIVGFYCGLTVISALVVAKKKYIRRTH